MLIILGVGIGLIAVMAAWAIYHQGYEDGYKAANQPKK